MAPLTIQRALVASYRQIYSFTGHIRNLSGFGETAGVTSNEHVFFVEYSVQVEPTDTCTEHFKVSCALYAIAVLVPIKRQKPTGTRKSWPGCTIDQAQLCRLTINGTDW